MRNDYATHGNFPKKFIEFDKNSLKIGNISPGNTAFNSGIEFRRKPIDTIN
jgi:hypothetical protein